MLSRESFWEVKIRKILACSAFPHWLLEDLSSSNRDTGDEFLTSPSDMKQKSLLAPLT